MMNDKSLQSLKANNVIIDNVSAFLTKLHELSHGQVVLFRGHSIKDYKLIPSVGRKDKITQANLYNKTDEKQMFLEFKRNYSLYTDDKPSSDIDILFLAQHFGVPTRLLDWTYNPLISLYFACQDTKIDGGHIYSLVVENDQSLIKENHYFDKGFFIDKKYKRNHYLIVPDYTNRRFLNQKGMFLLFKNPFEELKMQPTFIINNKKEILKELSVIGITESMVFPTLDSLGKEIANKYKKK